MIRRSAEICTPELQGFFGLLGSGDACFGYLQLLSTRPFARPQLGQILYLGCESFKLSLGFIKYYSLVGADTHRLKEQHSYKH